ncbi:MAG TPA: hypothetical protein DIW54_03535 [Chitinophagaceae bacterium]|nr:hypothetical protein [Chitinophagaceae bacterium]
MSIYGWILMEQERCGEARSRVTCSIQYTERVVVSTIVFCGVFMWRSMLH